MPARSLYGDARPEKSGYASDRQYASTRRSGWSDLDPRADALFQAAEKINEVANRTKYIGSYLWGPPSPGIGVFGTAVSTPRCVAKQLPPNFNNKGRLNTKAERLKTIARGSFPCRTNEEPEAEASPESCDSQPFDGTSGRVPILSLSSRPCHSRLFEDKYRNVHDKQSLVRRMRARRHLQDAISEGDSAAVLATAIGFAREVDLSPHRLRDAETKLAAIAELEWAEASGDAQRVANAVIEAARVGARAHVAIVCETVPPDMLHNLEEFFSCSSRQLPQALREYCDVVGRDDLANGNVKSSLVESLKCAADHNSLQAALVAAARAGVDEAVIAEHQKELGIARKTLVLLRRALVAGDCESARPLVEDARTTRVGLQEISNFEKGVLFLERFAEWQKSIPEVDGQSKVKELLDEFDFILTEGDDLFLSMGLGECMKAAHSERNKMSALAKLLTHVSTTREMDFESVAIHALEAVKARTVSLIRDAYAVKCASNLVAFAECSRKQIHNCIQDRKGAIRIFCRIRPPSKEEVASGMESVVKRVDDYSLEIVGTCTSPKIQGETCGFFDACWDPGTQEVVFDEVRGLVQSVVDGYNITIFAYGQTGSGKTYTMYGKGGMPGPARRRSSSNSNVSTWLPKRSVASRSGSVPSKTRKSAGYTSMQTQALRTPCVDPGICYQAADELFRLLEAAKDRYDYEVKFSMVELYCQRFIDLLDPDSDRLVKIRQTCDNKVFLENVSEEIVGGRCDIRRLLFIGASARHLRETAMNAESSRSHVLCIIKVSAANIETGQKRQSKMLMVDLAGSERMKRSEVTGDGVKEAIEVNKSLTAIGDVLVALQRAEQHVPYRNHELTQLMQDSVGGTAKTLMFLNVSPTTRDIDETRTSLEFAQKVMSVQNKPQVKRSVYSPRRNSSATCSSGVYASNGRRVSNVTSPRTWSPRVTSPRVTSPRRNLSRFSPRSRQA